MEKMLFNAICDMSSECINLFITDFALCAFINSVLGDDNEYVRYIYESVDSDNITTMELAVSRAEAIDLIRQWKKEKRVVPFDMAVNMPSRFK